MKVYKLLYDAMQLERQLTGELPAFSEEITQAIKKEHKLRVSVVLQQYFRQAEASDLIDFYESFLGQKVLLMESHITPEITDILIDVRKKFLCRDSYRCSPRSDSHYWALANIRRNTK